MMTMIVYNDDDVIVVVMMNIPFNKIMKMVMCSLHPISYEQSQGDHRH